MKFLHAIAVVLLSWLLFQAAHELGHVVAAWGCGVEVERVVLHPLTISRTDVAPNGQMLAITWGGPVVGCLLPLGIFLLWRLPGRYFFRFFAGFCLVANGMYIGTDFSPHGPTDAGVLIDHGATRWQLLLFGLLTTPLGLYLWHGQSKHFGSAVTRRATIIVILALAAVIAVECFMTGGHFAEGG